MISTQATIGNQAAVFVPYLCVQELADQGTINSRLQAGICDSFEALGAYMRGIPSAYHKHKQQMAHTASAIRQVSAIQLTGASVRYRQHAARQPGAEHYIVVMNQIHASSCQHREHFRMLRRKLCSMVG